MKLLQTLTFCAMVVGAQAAPWTTVQDTPLYFPATELGVGTTSQISAVIPQSVQGGSVSLVNTQVWTARYSGPASRHDQPVAMVVDGAGSVIVAGGSDQASSGSDFVVVKYSAAGTALWTNRFSSPGSGGYWGDICRDMVIDNRGDVYVSGESSVLSSLRDLVTLKYSSNGVPLWTNVFSTSASNDLQLSDMAMDSFGNTFLVAHDFAYLDGPDWIVAYNSAGTALWTNLHQTAFPQVNYGWTIQPDSTGRVFVGGEMLNDPGLASYGPDGSIGSAFAYKFDGALRELLVDRYDNLVVTAELAWHGSTVGYLIGKIANSGALLWTNAYPGPTYSGGTVPGTALDRAGNIFTTFASAGTGVFDVDFTTVKITADGVPAWTNRFYNPGGNGRFTANATDRTGNCYVLLSSTKQGQSNNLDYVLLKLAPDGSPVWTNRFDGGSEDSAWAVALDQQGNIFVTGATGTSWSDSDFLTVKYADYVLYTPPRGFVGIDSVKFTAVDLFGNTTTGQVSVTVSPVPLRLSTVARSPLGFRMRLEGLATTNTTVVLASSNLVHWTPIATNAPGTTEFTDAAALNFSQRFYKAITSDIESQAAADVSFR